MDALRVLGRHEHDTRRIFFSAKTETCARYNFTAARAAAKRHCFFWNPPPGPKKEARIQLKNEAPTTGLALNARSGFVPKSQRGGGPTGLDYQLACTRVDLQA
jgi:hypothetical protein